MLFASTDFLIFTYLQQQTTDTANRAARDLSVASQTRADCQAWTDVKQNAALVNIQIDPHSVNGDANPLTTPSVLSTPPVGAGYVYLYPAVATSTSNCNAPNGISRPGGQVIAVVTYSYRSITPVAGPILGQRVFHHVSVLQTEY